MVAKDILFISNMNRDTYMSEWIMFDQDANIVYIIGVHILTDSSRDLSETNRDISDTNGDLSDTIRD
jgi:hypothetical protein